MSEADLGKPMTIETKMNAPSGVNADARALANEMMAAFEALKAANDARIEEIEKRGAPDPLLDAKLKKIEQSLDRQRSALERLALEQDLKNAVVVDALQIYVQPQVDARGCVTGGELLLRWLDPKRGEVLPGDFIPVAEEAGLIARMGARVQPV